MTRVVPGPRISTGVGSSPLTRHGGVAPLLLTTGKPVDHNHVVQPRAQEATAVPVSLSRTSQGWQVTSPAGVDEVDDLVEGLSLADLVAEEFGVLVQPDRLARRSARGPTPVDGEDGRSVDARIAVLERTVTQLEHALAARVVTERAIGVLAERFGTDPRAAFESLRREARSSGRPVAELAREVLDAMVPCGNADIALTPASRSAEEAGPGARPLAVDGRS